MHFPRTLLVVATLLMLIAFSAPFYGQQPDQERDRQKIHEVTITGCLDKGDAPNQYVLTDPGSGSKMIVTGAAELEQHAAKHTEKLTGAPSDDNKSFAVSKVEHVADTCPASK